MLDSKHVNTGAEKLTGSLCVHFDLEVDTLLDEF
jgi:hypothetical protein